VQLRIYMYNCKGHSTAVGGIKSSEINVHYKRQVRSQQTKKKSKNREFGSGKDYEKKLKLEKLCVVS
jgi:hypothetical protein